MSLAEIVNEVESALAEIAVNVEGVLYFALFWTTFYWSWALYQGFVLFLPILLIGRARRLRAALVAGAGAVVGSPPRPRGLLPSDFWNVPGALALVLPFVAALSLEVTWVLAVVPLWAAPVVAGLFWMRLRLHGVRHARAVAWAVLSAPCIASILYLVPRMGTFQWQSRDWDGSLVYHYVARNFAVRASDLENAALVMLVLLAAAVVASRFSALRGFLDLLLLLTVPAFALVLLSMPLGSVYSAWCFAVAGFWVSWAGLVSQDGSRVVPIERPLVSRMLTGGATVTKHDRWQTFRLAGALALATAVLLGLWSVLPPDIGIRAVGEWASIIVVGVYGFVRLRRSMGASEAAGVAVISQVAAIAIFVMASNVAHVMGDAFSQLQWLDVTNPERQFLDSFDSIQIELQILGVMVLALASSLVLSCGTRRYGALLVGAAWPLVGAMVFKANELALHEQDGQFRWEDSQVWGAAIGASVALAVMWRVFGPNVPEAAVTAEPKGRAAPAEEVPR